MRLIDDILRHRSLAVVGLEKNTGKTECLNYVLRNLPAGTRTAVTSIGTDGERVDVVSHTAKPEIWLRAGTVFATSERYYAERRLTAEILDVGVRATALGRMVTARALSDGKVMISGPPSTGELKLWMESLGRFGVELTIIDGALSRMSSASPAVTEAMILSTGAAFSADMNTLVRETAYKVELIGLPLAPAAERNALAEAKKGVWKIDGEGRAVRLHGAGIASTDELKAAIGDDCRTIYVAGALTPRILGALGSGGTASVSTASATTDEVSGNAGAAGMGRTSEGMNGTAVPGHISGMPRIIAADFTKIFIPSAEYRRYAARGGRLEVMRRSQLLAVCVNPTAPNGMALDSETLMARMSEAVAVPVYDIMKV